MTIERTGRSGQQKTETDAWNDESVSLSEDRLAWLDGFGWRVQALAWAH
jgi:hypothetical protein